MFLKQIFQINSKMSQLPVTGPLWEEYTGDVGNVETRLVSWHHEILRV